jgi:crotonobetainyl-CoA:carnitine CoA-transferase CaiB-like acyl-CoA transferase
MKVVELARGASASFAGQLLAQLGAEVISVDVGARDMDAATMRFVDRHTTRVALSELPTVVRDADALVEDLGPGGLESLGYSVRRLRRLKTGLVFASISPFGLSGPHASWSASELVVQAMGGMVHSTGWDGEAPLKLAGSMAAFIAGLHAAIAVFAARHGTRTGRERGVRTRGVRIDISQQEAFLQHWSRHIGQWSYNGTGQRRDRRTLDGQGVPTMAQTADGWMCLAVRNARWDTVADVLGLADYVGAEWQSSRARVERWHEIAPHFDANLRTRGKHEWFAAAAERGLIFGPVQDLHDVLDSEQYAARGYFERAEVDGELVDCPGLPFTWET